jgi:hypothetical protein
MDVEGFVLTRRGGGVKEAAMIRWLPLLATAALLAAGCAQQVVRPPVDPFLGDTPRETAKDPDKEFVGRAPADPPVSTPAGPAEITAGPAGVSIGSPRPTEAKPKEPENNTSGLAPAPPPGTGSPLEQVSAPAPPPPPEPPAVTYESLQKALQARGVAWQQLQCMGNDRWHFLCAIPVPDPSNPGLRDSYEVTRTGNLGLNAIQAVIEQIDKERSAPPPQAFER